MIIVIDESGDLGFDFTKDKTSRYFVITLLVLDSTADANVIRKAIKRSIRYVHGRKPPKYTTTELKGSDTQLKVKKHFWRKVANLDFGIYAYVLNKRSVNPNLRRRPDKLYNYLARILLDQLPLKQATEIDVIIDRSKSSHEIRDFDKYLTIHLAGVDPRTLLRIDHVLSHEEKAIQAVDLFCWGVFRKYERNDVEWHNVFAPKIRFEAVYLR